LNFSAASRREISEFFWAKLHLARSAIKLKKKKQEAISKEISDVQLGLR